MCSSDLLFDGQRRSWWHTDGATPAGTALTLVFDTAVTVSMVELQMGAWTAGAPGDLEVLVDDGPGSAATSVWRGSTRGLAVIGGLTFVVLTMEAVGYVAAMFVFYLVLVVLLGTRAPLAIIAVTLLGSFGTSTVFTRYLKQALPLGTWWM